MHHITYPINNDQVTEYSEEDRNQPSISHAIVQSTRTKLYFFVGSK